MGDIEEIHKLKKVFDDTIYSIVKYGFGKRNLIVIIKNGNIDYLIKIKAYILALRRKKNILVISYDDINQTNFGIDLLNIKLTSVVIYGKDIFKEFKIDNLKIKRQIRYEANKQLIALKNELLSRKWPWQMRDLLFSTIPRILPLIVAHLYIKGEKIPNAIPDTINRYVKHNENAVVLLKIRKKMTPEETKALYQEVFGFLKNLAEKV